MAWELVTTIEQTLVQTFGSLWLVALGLLIIFFICYLLLQIDFRVSAVALSPLAYAFFKSGWFAGWIGYIFVVVILGYGVFMYYERFRTQ